jgi:hypothetical protein
LTLHDTLVRLRTTFAGFIEWPRAEHATLLAVWTVGTYFHALYPAFPRLSLSGERGSGKSKVLALLHALAWNAMEIVTPTPAVLFRLITEFRATLLLDELEGLNRDDAGEVRALLNAGYKAGAVVPRVEGKDTRRVEAFPVYAPAVVAAIRAPNPVTEDRCIPITMQRGLSKTKINATVNPHDADFARMRAACYALLLDRWQAMRGAVDAVDLPPWLNARARELWAPLLAIADLADDETDDTPHRTALLTLAKEHVDDRATLSEEGEAVFKVLDDCLGSALSVMVRPRDLVDPLHKLLRWRDPPTPETVGQWLSRRFRIPKDKPPRDSEGVRYRVTREVLDGLKDRYGSGDKDQPERDGC